MKLRTFLYIPAVIAILYALGMLIVPEGLASSYGLGTGASEILLARFFGATLLIVGIIQWMVRDLPAASVRPVVLGSLIGDALGLVISLMGTLNGVMNSMGWSAVVIYGVLTLGFAYFQFTPSAK